MKLWRSIHPTLQGRREGAGTGSLPHPAFLSHTSVSLTCSRIDTAAHTQADTTSSHIRTSPTHQMHTHVVHRDTHAETWRHTLPEARRHPRTCRHGHSSTCFMKPLPSHSGWERWARWGMSVGSLVWKPDCTETISCLSLWLILLVEGQHGLDMQGGGRAVQLGSVS